MPSLTENDTQKISDKLDRLFDVVNQLSIGQARLEEKMTNLDNKINNLDQRLDEKINSLDQRLNEKISNLDQRLEEKITSLDQRLAKIETSQETLIKDVSDLKGAKSLIVPLIVAVTTSLVTLLIRAIPNP